MKKQLRILLAGVLVVAPFALTIWLIVQAGMWLDNLVAGPLESWGMPTYPGIGALILIVALYLVGLLTHFWLFRGLVKLLEQMVSRLPGAKVIYESIRDLLKLFGGDAKEMGRVVLYSPPGTEMTMLAILTNEHPGGLGSPDKEKVAIYLPYSFMFGGITVYVSPDRLKEVDTPVEEALKLCATAQVGSSMKEKTAQVL